MKHISTTVSEKHGVYPVGTNDCFSIGISGNCNFNCPVLQSGECEGLKEALNEYTKEQLMYLYDNGYYEEEIKLFLNIKDGVK